MTHITRTRTEIISQILRVANEGDGATKTKIMYGVFLSHG
ncbi:MAG: winged helix-turn-helix domain-containing protein, partial [Thermoproteota archaeon]|nr:winged helix-turn-helix domain-containing protein [Thermoproteota archaeon]